MTITAEQIVADFFEQLYKKFFMSVILRIMNRQGVELCLQEAFTASMVEFNENIAPLASQNLGAFMNMKAGIERLFAEHKDAILNTHDIIHGVVKPEEEASTQTVVNLEDKPKIEIIKN